MKKLAYATAALIAAAAIGAGAASASEDGCKGGPKAEWKTSGDVKSAAEAAGYKVDRVKTDDGCYEVYGLDQGGKRVELLFDPVSLQLVRVKGKS